MQLRCSRMLKSGRTLMNLQGIIIELLKQLEYTIHSSLWHYYNNSPSAMEER
jgi:hypothetical protein